MVLNWQNKVSRAMFVYKKITQHCSDFLCSDDFLNRTFDTFALTQTTKTD